MTTQIKLTDTVLHELADALTSIDHPWAEDYVEAIRALRNAAMAVCDSSREQWSVGYSICCAVDEDKVDELRKLLPKNH